ncbi:MAG: hypothetical protein RL706_2279, partial [Pseudomonadota bacterium]
IEGVSALFSTRTDVIWTGAKGPIRNATNESTDNKASPTNATAMCFGVSRGSFFMRSFYGQNNVLSVEQHALIVQTSPEKHLT